MKRIASLNVVVTALVMAMACGGGAPPLTKKGRGGAGAISGHAVKGAVIQGKVTAYKLSPDFKRGDALGDSMTDEGGAFTLSPPAYSGAVLLVVSSGSYLEEAYGATVKVDGHELTAVLPSYRAATSVDRVAINPVTHLVAKLAGYYVIREGAKLAEAVSKAQQHLNSHFGGVDWSHITPTDFGVADAGVSFSDADRAGLINSALSQEALTISNTAGITPGSSVTSLVLVETLGDDLGADGFLDGVGPAGQLVLPQGGQVTPSGASASKLDGQAARLLLSLSASRFLQGSSNATHLTVADAQTLLDGISRDADPTLFRGGGTGFDEVAPSVVITDAKDKYQRASTITLTATVDDGSSGSGVKAAYALAFGDAPIAGSFDAATNLWTFTDVPLAQGKNVVSVWGEDKANNSGRTGSAPYKVAPRLTPS